MNILEYIPEIIIGLLTLAIAIFFVIKYIKSSPAQKKEILKQIIYALAIEAEKLYKGKTGQAKKKQVIAWLYEKYPVLSVMVNQATLDVYIDEQVTAMNEWFRNNPDAVTNILGQND